MSARGTSARLAPSSGACERARTVQAAHRNASKEKTAGEHGRQQRLSAKYGAKRQQAGLQKMTAHRHACMRHACKAIRSPNSKAAVDLASGSVRTCRVKGLGVGLQQLGLQLLVPLLEVGPAAGRATSNKACSDPCKQQQRP